MATFTLLPFGAVQNQAYVLPIVQTLPVDKDGNFGGGCVVPGGWYSLSVSAGDAIVAVRKVGAGEVLVLFGHSYIQGGHDKSHQLPATDERVIALLDSLDQKNYQFGPLAQNIGPFHGDPDEWSQLGDLLVKRLNVPLLFYTDQTSRQPLAPLEFVMDNYVSKTGVRAVLFEHGNNDWGTSRANFTDMLKRFTTYVRDRWQKPALPFVLVQEQLSAVPGSLYDIPTSRVLQTH